MKAHRKRANTPFYLNIIMPGLKQLCKCYLNTSLFFVRITSPAGACGITFSRFKAFVVEVTQINVFVHGICSRSFLYPTCSCVVIITFQLLYVPLRFDFHVFMCTEDWILFFYFSFIAVSYARIAIIHPRLLNCSLVNSKFTEDSKFQVKKRINEKKDQRKMDSCQLVLEIACGKGSINQANITQET